MNSFFHFWLHQCYVVKDELLIHVFLFLFLLFLWPSGTNSKSPKTPWKQHWWGWRKMPHSWRRGVRFLPKRNRRLVKCDCFLTDMVLEILRTLQLWYFYVTFPQSPFDSCSGFFLLCSPFLIKVTIATLAYPGFCDIGGADASSSMLGVWRQWIHFWENLNNVAQHFT